MPTTTFYADKTTNTFADALQAVGLAEALYAWLSQLGRPNSPIRINDCGGYYRIDFPAPLGEDDATAVKAPFRAGRGDRLVTAKHKKKALDAGQPEPRGYPYDDKKAQRDVYIARLNKLASADRVRYNKNPNADEFAEMLSMLPDEDLSLYVAINHFKIADSYNKLCDRWRGASLDDFQVNLTLLLQTFSCHPNKLPSKGDVETALQVVNPASGKGNNSPKASGLSIGGIDNFWLSEYLKFVGYFTIAAPLLVRESKDRKTYVLHPVRVELSALRDVMIRFRAGFFRATAVKLDILAALRFTLTLVEYIGREQSARATNASAPAFFGIRPRVTAIARGFDVAFYKDMGSAYATMNLASINLPDWLQPIISIQDAEAMQTMLTEHERAIVSIKSAKGDEGSDEIELLRRYRDFLSGHDVERFFDFAARYGDYLLAKRHRNQWAGQLTTDGMEQLMAQAQGDKNLTQIVKAPGFRAIARAIRHATVTGQYLAAQRNGYPYEVRYGLGHDLLRSAAYPQDFISALGVFAQAYSAENARMEERYSKPELANTPKFHRPVIRDSDLDQIVALVDAFGSDVICKMLVAYGYARDTHAQPEEAPPATDTDPAGIDDDTDI
ncbi:MAG TPA: hypothetical protein VFU63_12230 [Ktedonobacterales bacterium]|nr:hypothetical protein [Ktedonobacterales bacterium]